MTIECFTCKTGGEILLIQGREFFSSCDKKACHGYLGFCQGNKLGAIHDVYSMETKTHPVILMEEESLF